MASQFDKLAKIQKDITSGINLPFAPSEEQKKFAEALVLSSKTNAAQVCKEVGINPKEVYKWLKDMRFNMWLTEVRRNNFIFWKPHIDRAMIKKALKGNVGAAKLIYQATGDLDETVEQKTMKAQLGTDKMNIGEQYVEFQQRIKRLTGKLGNQEKIEVEKIDIQDAEIVEEKTEPVKEKEEELEIED
jgi:adenylosuccinate synthase